MILKKREKKKREGRKKTSDQLLSKKRAETSCGRFFCFLGIFFFLLLFFLLACCRSSSTGRSSGRSDHRCFLNRFFDIHAFESRNEGFYSSFINSNAGGSKHCFDGTFFNLFSCFVQ